MGFTSLLADIDMWFKASTDKDGNNYYTYIFFNIDNTLILYEAPCKFMSMLMDK